jgi:hypothetical protein
MPFMVIVKASKDSEAGRREQEERLRGGSKKC